MHATMLRLQRFRYQQLAIVVTVAAALTGWPAVVSAQHGDYVLGSLGLLGGAQAPEGIYYQNIFSYYNASGSGVLDASRTRDLQVFGRQLGLTANANLNLKQSLNAYVDQNIIGMTTPFKILGANYGFMIDLPFDEVHGTGDAGLDVGGLDPDGGKVYKTDLWVEEGKRKVRGYVGLFYRTQTWLK